MTVVLIFAHRKGYISRVGPSGGCPREVGEVLWERGAPSSCRREFRETGFRARQNRAARRDRSRPVGRYDRLGETRPTTRTTAIADNRATRFSPQSTRVHHHSFGPEPPEFGHRSNRVAKRKRLPGLPVGLLRGGQSFRRRRGVAGLRCESIRPCDQRW